VLFAGACLAAPLSSADVVLNEIDCDGTDWVELVNTGDTPEEISGWRLSDDPLPGGDFYTFPNPTVIAAGDRIAVDRGSGGFAFGISCNSDTIRLANATPVVVDEETLPGIDFDLDTWGRHPDGTGEWRQTFPTKGAPNQPSPSGVDEAAELFDPTRVVQVELGLPPDSEAALRDPETWEDYQDGTFTLTAGSTTYGPLDVGIRLKGGVGSFRTLDEKAAFKVRFPHSIPGQRLLGLKTLTLNNMVQDPSSIREVLAYEAFRALGIPAPRTGYAYVGVNGDAYGLYLNVETFDDVGLRRWYPETQHLYEGGWGTDVSPGGAEAFEVDEGSEEDRSDLEALIAAAHDGGADGWSDRLEPFADLQGMTRMWAVEKYVGHWDGYSGLDSPNHPNNYYLHSDPAGRFTMLPWGTDRTWVDRIPFDGPSAILFDRCLADEACMQLFRSAVLQARQAISSLDLDAEAALLADELGPWQALDPRTTYTPAQVGAGVDAVRAFIAARPTDADNWLNPPVGEPPGPPSLGPPVATAQHRSKRKRCKRAKRGARSAKCLKRKRRR
jgi:hypothetical protein